MWITKREARRKSVQRLEDIKAGRIKFFQLFTPDLHRHYDYWEFPSLNLIAGPSGHGKSYFLSKIIKNAFQGKNKDLNILWFHFGLEMRPDREEMRDIATEQGVSYKDLKNPDNPVSEDKLQDMLERLAEDDDVMLDNLHYYADSSINRLQFIEQVKKIRRKNPDRNIAISVDHLLLVGGAKDSEGEVEVQANLAKSLVQVAQSERVMIVPLGQMNDKIENPMRLSPDNPSMHYPTKTDLHGSKQVYQAMDTVTMVYQPALNNITDYGRHRLPTVIKGLNLFAVHCIKDRDGRQFVLAMINELNKGLIRDLTENEKLEITNG